MATAEEIFNSAQLEVVVPEELVEIPTEHQNAADWLLALCKVKQRDKAFFDERLLLLFTVKVLHPVAEPVGDLATPPLALAQFLAHLQITVDAKYISPQQQQQQYRRSSALGAGHDINLTLPPRSHSFGNGGQRPPPPGDRPSIFPPQTPNPTPQADEADRQYASSSARTEGTVLESFVWGETQREDSAERNFALVWSSSENVWVAVYRLHIGVSFLRTPVAEPLLSLTISATLREKPLKMTLERQGLAALISAASGGQISNDTTPVPVNGTDETPEQEDVMNGLEEVNLLDGLSQSPTFGGPSKFSLTLPSVRLAPSLRRAAYSLPPVKSGSPKLTPSSANDPPSDHQPRKSAPVLRKSFLKTLQTVSGFQIRMKSVFVPYVVIPGSDDDEGERREAGSEERTVVLSVELGNGSESRGPQATGFAVEGVEVTIGGEGATANLISWGENGFTKSDAIFPLLIKPAEQFNVLYAVTFLRQSEQDDVGDSLRRDATGGKLPSPTGGDMQRHVSIVIRGRPFDLSEDPYTIHDPRNLSYPTQTFRSRWNCVLDLLSAGQSETFSQNFDVSTDHPSARDALPAPASPFPVASPRTTRHTLPPNWTSAVAVAGRKRHTIGGLADRGNHRMASPNPGYRASTPVINVFNNSSVISSTIPPLSVGNRSTAMPSTMPSSPVVPRTPGVQPPPTPAYPAYPSDTIPQPPAAQSPISHIHLGGGTGPSVEPRRERMSIPGGIPQTPGPRMVGAFFADQTTLQDAEDEGDPIVVSVELVALEDHRVGLDLDTICALDTFGIEIFVFNRSGRTRRFEVSYPERKRRRHQSSAAELSTFGDNPSGFDRQTPGILPLENRIRVGPLRPHTCQSVRMQFLALQPGVHSIHSLTLTDVETGYSKNLKSVMDVVVRETDEV